jgi:hypothetical protein
MKVNHDARWNGLLGLHARGGLSDVNTAAKGITGSAMPIRPTNTNPSVKQLTWLTTQALVSTHFVLRKLGASPLSLPGSGRRHYPPE